MKEHSPMTERQQAALLAVKKLYESSDREMGTWMWQHHVQWVAQKAAELAKKYYANVDQTFAAALLHDIGDVWMERTDEQFEAVCEETARKILTQAGFTDDEIEFVLTEVIAPHSCHEDQPLPSTIEGQVLATADGLAHLLTDFYYDFEAMGKPVADPQEFRSWALNKSKRDYHRKLFFDDEKQMATQAYQKLQAYLQTEPKS